MDEFINNLKREAEEKPWLALAVTAGLITATSKLINSLSWRQEVARRTMKVPVK